MFTILKSLAVVGAIGAASLAAQPARADNVSFGLGVNVGRSFHSNFGGGSRVIVGGSFIAPPVTYYSSGPNYYQPAYSYYPAPVYYQQPAYCPPQVVYQQPTYYYPAPVVYYPTPYYYSQPSLSFDIGFGFGRGFGGRGFGGGGFGGRGFGGGGFGGGGFHGHR